MIEIEGSGTELATTPSGKIAKSSQVITAGQLELALLGRYPREDAEEWDRTGLLVGDPSAPVSGVAVALDVTSEAIEATRRMGANVLLTHHPAYLEPPAAFTPSYASTTASGVNVYEAISQGIALMCFHTALDASPDVARLLPSMLNLDFERLIVPRTGNPEKGYGQLCAVRSEDAPFKLAHLAARCTSVFGRAPRMWGDASLPLQRVVIANGSASGVMEAALAERVDCLVCGEARYHAALDAAQAGLAIIELGHDVSELPLCALLAQAAIDAGVPADAVRLLDARANWSIPDATRI